MSFLFPVLLLSGCAQALRATRGANQEDMSSSLCLDTDAGLQNGMFVASQLGMSDAPQIGYKAPPVLPFPEGLLRGPQQGSPSDYGAPEQLAKAKGQEWMQKNKYAKAEEAKTELDTFAGELARKYDFIKILEAPIKGRARAAEKVEEEYDGDWSSIKDLARVAIVVPHPDNIPTVKDAIMERFVPSEGYGHYDHFKHEKAEADECGYPTNTVFVFTKAGLEGEIQISTNNLMYAKTREEKVRPLLGDAVYDDIRNKSDLDGGKGHLLYKIWRNPKTSKPLKEKVANFSKGYYGYFLGGEGHWESHEGQQLKKALKEKLTEPELEKALKREKQNVDAKNRLDEYLLTMPNALQDEKLKDGDKAKIKSAVQDTLDWLDKHRFPEKDELKAKQRELERIVKNARGR
mmetsp:Transcript_34891/g.64606  ORF Transcript_34891/g.64606 Transcript_34891/m.64606 type:complete len:404 (-) Transcript_34891:118-1329(-)